MKLRCAPLCCYANGQSKYFMYNSIVKLMNIRKKQIKMNEKKINEVKEKVPELTDNGFVPNVELQNKRYNESQKNFNKKRGLENNLKLLDLSGGLFGI